MKKFLFLLILTGFVLPTHAQTTAKVWSLREAIEYAIQNNLFIKQQHLLTENARLDYEQSKYNLYPSLNGGASYSWNYGRTIDRYTNQFALDRVASSNIFLQTGATLFSGFQKVNAIKQNKVNLAASEAEAEKVVNDISLNIASGYLQALYLKELAQMQRNQLEVTGLQVDRIKKLIQVGTAAEGEVFAVEAQRALEESNVIATENNLGLALLTLSQLLDLPSHQGFDIEIPELDMNAYSAELNLPQQIYTVALENQPDIQAARLRLESSQLGLDIARGGYFPSLSVGGSWGTGYSGASQIVDQTSMKPMSIGYVMNADGTKSDVYTMTPEMTYRIKPWSDQLKDNNNYSLGLSLSIPIFNNFQNRTLVQRSKINIANAQLSLDVKEQQLRKTIEQAWSDAVAAMKQYEVSLKKVAAMKEAFRYAETKFSVGTMNSLDYNNAKKDLTNAESELIQNKFDFIFKNTILDFYMNKPLNIR